MSNTLPKYDWNLNCLSYGSNVLMKLDTVDLLRAQFERFESHFRNNEHVIYDGKIPLFVVEAFSKLWKLWIDFPELHDVIKRSLFYEVFQEMSSFFRTEKDRPTETVVASEAVHLAQGEETRRPGARHFMLLDEFQGCEYPLQLQSKTPFAVPCSNLPLDQTNGPSTSILLLTPDPGINRQLITESCVLNDSSRFQKDAKNKTQNFHSNAMSKSNTPHSNFHSTAGTCDVSDIFFKTPSLEDPHCGSCCRLLNSGETVDAHLQSLKHKKNEKLMEESLYYLEKHKHALILQSERTMRFMCRACAVVQEGMNCLIQHCKSKTHLNKVTEPLTEFSLSAPPGLY